MFHEAPPNSHRDGVWSMLKLAVLALLLGLHGCISSEEPTELPTPQGALDIGRVAFSGGNAHQTHFTLEAPYPDNRVLHHYAEAIPDPWVRCDWAPEWQDFLDATMTPNRTVHQQLHVWINRKARREIVLSMRYLSPPVQCAERPSNDNQQVVVVEYFGVDIDDTISKLKLHCPARPLAAAGDAPGIPKSCGKGTG